MLEGCIVLWYTTKYNTYVIYNTHMYIFLPYYPTKRKKNGTHLAMNWSIRVSPKLNGHVWSPQVGEFEGLRVRLGAKESGEIREPAMEAVVAMQIMELNGGFSDFPGHGFFEKRKVFQGLHYSSPPKSDRKVGHYWKIEAKRIIKLAYWKYLSTDFETPFYWKYFSTDFSTFFLGTIINV